MLKSAPCFIEKQKQVTKQINKKKKNMSMLFVFVCLFVVCLHRQKDQPIDVIADIMLR